MVFVLHRLASSVSSGAAADKPPALQCDDDSASRRLRGMPKKVWNVNLADGPRKVELEHGWLSGKRAIQVDGKVVHESSRFADFGGEYPVQVGGHSALVIIRMNGLWPSYDLLLDGASVQS